MWLKGLYEWSLHYLGSAYDIISTSGTPEKAALFDWNVPLSVVLVDAKR